MKIKITIPKQVRHLFFSCDANVVYDYVCVMSWWRAEAVYPGAEIVIGDEDTQLLDTPIIAAVKAKTYSYVESRYFESLSSCRLCV